MRTPEQIASTIDHAILSPYLSQQELEEGLDLACELNVASACVKPCDVRLAKHYVWNRMKLASVVGFPHGNSCLHTKEYEACLALDHGADEVDYVINTTNVLNGDWHAVACEMERMHSAIHARSGIVKVIFETYYTGDYIQMLCQLATKTGADFVKTSTGFATHGATLYDVELMTKWCEGTKCQVKASGGIKTLEQVETFLNAGATRVGSSATKKIVEEARLRQVM